MKDKANNLEVMFFEPTAGLDAETCAIFNDYCKRLKDTFEVRMYHLATQNAEMSHKLELYQTQKQVSDLTACELVGMAFLRGESPLVLWREFRRNISEEAMRHIAENEFEEIISDITQETI